MTQDLKRLKDLTTKNSKMVQSTSRSKDLMSKNSNMARLTHSLTRELN